MNRLLWNLPLAVLAVALVGCAKFQSEPISPQQTADKFNTRSLAGRGVCEFLRTNHVAVPSGTNAWNLRALTLVAFYYEPTLAEARAQLAAEQTARITAGERPNPTMTILPGYDSGVPGAPTPWLVTVSGDWPIETAGKRRKRMAQAGHLAEAAQWSLTGALWRARSQVRNALLAMEVASQTEKLLLGQVNAQSNVVRLLEGQYAAGSISGYEVTQARVLLDDARLQWQNAVNQRGTVVGQMADALGVPMPALDDVHFAHSGLGQISTNVNLAEIKRKALLDRADVREALAQYEASQSALQLEIALQYPDIHLGPGYAWNTANTGDNLGEFGLTMTLPIMNHNQGPVAEATANRTRAAAHFQTVQAAAIGEINLAATGYTAALQQAAAAKTLLVNLQRRMDLVRSQERAGEADGLAVANAAVEFEASAQSQFTAAFRLQEALAQLEDAVETPLVFR